MLPDQFFGEERQSVRRGTKGSTKIEVTSPTRSLGKTFEPGINQGMYDAWEVYLRAQLLPSVRTS